MRINMFFRECLVKKKLIEIILIELFLFFFSHIQRHHDANIAKMQTMISALQDLDSLNKRFNLTLTLDDYINVSFDVMNCFIY